MPPLYDPNYDPILEERRQRGREEIAALAAKQQDPNAHRNEWDMLLSPVTPDYSKIAASTSAQPPNAGSTDRSQLGPVSATPYDPIKAAQEALYGAGGVPPYNPFPRTDAEPPPPAASIRAVRMPGGKVVFTNDPQTGGTTLSNDEGRAAARSIGAMGSTGGSYTPSGNADSSVRSFGQPGGNQALELVQRAGLAKGFGQAEPWGLAPSNTGGTTPAYDEMVQQQAESAMGRLGARAGVATAKTAASTAEDWANMSPQQRLKSQAELKALEKPNMALDAFKYIQGQFAQLGLAESQISAKVAALYPNDQNADTARLRQQKEAEMRTAIAEERQRLLQITQGIYRSDPMLSIGASAVPQGGVNQTPTTGY